jgi:hypothetical protein
MAGLLAVIAVAVPNIPESNGDRLRADLTSDDDTDGGGDHRPDRLAFDDRLGVGIDAAANILSPAPDGTTGSDPSSADSEGQMTTTSMNAEPPTTSIMPGSTSTPGGGDSGGDVDGAGQEGDPVTGDGAEPGAGSGHDDDNNPATGGNEWLVERYYNDFSSGDLDADNWLLDDGSGPTRLGLRRPAAVSVVADEQATGGHVLQITATMGTGNEIDQVVSGAMHLTGFGQTYGRYRARVRIDADPDQTTSGALVLTAEGAQSRQDRISFFETWANRSTRTPVEAYLYRAREEGSPFLVQTHAGMSGTDWHTYTMDWRKDRVTVSADDGEPLLLSDDPSVIPDQDLDLVVRLDTYDSPVAPGRPPSVSGPVRLQIDWIRIEVVSDHEDRGAAHADGLAE